MKSEPNSPDGPRQFSLFETAPTDMEKAGQPAGISHKFSDFIAYVDESGDHGMVNVDANYPVFVLSLCVFHKRYYSEKVVPVLEKFKFNHFGHDLVVLHEHEIRKEKGNFTFFRNRDHKLQFLADLTSIIEASNFILISCVIDKERLRAKEVAPPNPYHIALGFCLETLYEFLKERGRKTKSRILRWSVAEKRKITNLN